MPEKNTSEIPRDVRDLFEKGNAAVQKENWDYAFLFYLQALQKEPGYLECRQALRAAQVSKANRSTSFFKKVMGAAGSSPAIAKANMLVSKKPLDAIATCEDILNSDPNNTTAHNLLAQAALNADLPKTAIFSLENNRKNNPTDRGVAMALANAYIAAKAFSKAENIYQDLLNKDRNDTEVANLLKNLSANKTLQEGGYEALADGKGSYRDILKNKEEAIALEQENKQVRSIEQTLKLLDEAVDKLREDPSNFMQAKIVADLYAQAKDYDKAIKYYGMLMEVGAGDANMERIVNELKVKRFDQQVIALDKESPDYAQQRAEIERQKAEFQIEDVKRRVEKYPNDLLIRYDYAVMLLKLARYNEALPEFQKTRNHGNRRVPSLVQMARIFIATGKTDFAIARLQDALKEKVGMDEEKKDILYMLGGLYEKMSKREEAMEQYKVIYEVDAGYKDVAQKVDDYYK
ncbi:MAG: Tetratricopeptide domain protein [Verrucomicrobia bacterium]|jgi:tetratricopeptide (TPR) repeat protein|nr:Tetratricopeptide domain protein [Verrucomicrobiota bacterium]